MCRRSKIPIVLILGVAGFVLRSHGTLPDNDNFATRFVLVGTNVTAGGSNAGATEEPGEPDPSLLGEKSVWWTWTAPRDGGLTLTTTGSDFDTMLTLFTGNSLTNLTFVAFNDEDPPDDQHQPHHDECRGGHGLPDCRGWLYWRHGTDFPATGTRAAGAAATFIVMRLVLVVR